MEIATSLRIVTTIAKLLVKGMIKTFTKAMTIVSPVKSTKVKMETEKPSKNTDIRTNNSNMKENTSSTVNKQKSKSPSNIKEMEQQLKKSGLKNIQLNNEQKKTLMEKGRVVIDGGKKVVHKVTTPAGYAYRAYENVNSITRQGIAEL